MLEISLKKVNSVQSSWVVILNKIIKAFKTHEKTTRQEIEDNAMNLVNFYK